MPQRPSEGPPKGPQKIQSTLSFLNNLKFTNPPSIISQIYQKVRLQNYLEQLDMLLKSILKSLEKRDIIENRRKNILVKDAHRLLEDRKV